MSKKKKINKALQDDRTRAWVEKALEKYKDKGTSQSSVSITLIASSLNQSASSPTGSRPQVSNWDVGSFVFSSFSAATWQLQGSWILDHGSNSHVCNRTVYSRSTKPMMLGPS